jgi:hypothetical protein
LCASGSRLMLEELPGEKMCPELRHEAHRSRRHQQQQEHEALTRRYPPPCDLPVRAASRLCLDPAGPRRQQGDPRQRHRPQPARQPLDARRPPRCIRPIRQAHRCVPCGANATGHTVTPRNANRNNRANTGRPLPCRREKGDARAPVPAPAGGDNRALRARARSAGRAPATRREVP